MAKLKTVSFLTLLASLPVLVASIPLVFAKPCIDFGSPVEGDCLDAHLDCSTGPPQTQLQCEADPNDPNKPRYGEKPQSGFFRLDGNQNTTSKPGISDICLKTYACLWDATTSKCAEDTNQYYALLNKMKRWWNIC